MDNTNSTEIKPALLSKSEIEYLLNKKQVTANYEYVIKHRVKEKLDRFIKLELPLLEGKQLLQNTVRILQNTVRSRNGISSDNPNNSHMRLGASGGIWTLDLFLTKEAL